MALNRMFCYSAVKISRGGNTALFANAATELASMSDDGSGCHAARNLLRCGHAIAH